MSENSIRIQAYIFRAKISRNTKETLEKLVWAPMSEYKNKLLLLTLIFLSLMEIYLGL
jgi:hypothetical protein